MKHAIRLHAFEQYLFRVTRVLYFFLIGLFFIRFFIVSVGQVNGPSMEPNFIDGDLFYINKLSYLYRDPERFDVVQVVDMENNMLLLKRIIGLPGETVVIKRRRVFIDFRNGIQRVLDESNHLSPDTITTVWNQQGAASFVVSQGEYFILGDNRKRSGDSRDYGPIVRDRIVGKVYRF